MIPGRLLISARTIGALSLTLAAILAQRPTFARQSQPIYEPGMENEIWKSQPPNKIGRRVQPNCITAWEEVDGFETPVAPVADLNSCDPLAQWTQEETELQAALSTPDPEDDDLPVGHDQFLFPVGVAVYDPVLSPNGPSHGFPTERRVLVADTFNHRILSFREKPNSNGEWISLANSAADADEISQADWNGFEGLGVPPHSWPQEFEGLKYPQHLAVDRGGYVWMANAERCRVEIFTPVGEFQGVVRLSNAGDCEASENRGMFPYGIAVNQDAEYGVGGRAAIIAQDFRTDTSHLIVLDAKNLEEIGRHPPEPTLADAPGALSGATAVAYHRVAGTTKDRLVVADTFNNRIQVFDTDARGAPVTIPVLVFGAAPLNDPVSDSPVPASQLQEPYAVHVDRRGRVLVSDSIGSREAFFQVDFSDPPSVRFLYELNARGGLNGAPRGVAEDSTDRLYIADMANHEIEVFEIPDLAVINIELIPPNTRVNQMVAVQFDVVIPETKTTLTNVKPSCVGSANLSPLSGPTPLDPALVFDPITGVPEMQPVPLEIHRFECQFVAGPEADNFEITLGAAGGPGGIKTAPAKVALGRIIECPAPCEAEPPTITAVATSTPQPVDTELGIFYPGDANITLTATDDGSGVTRIYWRWISPTVMSAMTNPCPDQLAPIQCATVSAAQTATQVVVANRNGVSTLKFWAEDLDGNLSEPGTVTVWVDKQPPNVLMNVRTPHGGVSYWYTQDVVVDLIITDELGTPASFIDVTQDGEPFGERQFVFTGEGRNLEQTIRVEDLAGNFAIVSSADQHDINIDRHPPVTTARSALGVLTNDQVFPTEAPPVFTLSAIDPQLSTGEEGSGVTNTFFRVDGGVIEQWRGITILVAAPGTHTLEFWSRDLAGNIESRHLVTFRIAHNLPPICIGAVGGEIWPPNHKKFFAITIKGVADPEGQDVSFLITKIEQDEPVDTTGDGKFSPDANGVNTSTAWVRGERMGGGNGRVYRISFTATDTQGGSCSGLVYTTVPHSQGQKAGNIAGPIWYDSTVHVPGARNK